MIFKLSCCNPATSRTWSTTVSVLSLIGVSLVALIYFVTWPTARTEIPPKIASSVSERVTHEGEPKSIPPIELGIVPADESRRLIFPFSRLGILEEAIIDSISTSCECIHASVVISSNSPAKQGDSPKRWIAIEHHPENDKSNASSISLRVECKVHLSDSTTQSFTVDFDSISPNALASHTPEPMAIATAFEGAGSLSDRTSKSEASADGSISQGASR
jgi:hypothetical protein